MPKISKQKLFNEKDNLEILRFSFYVDPETVTEQFKEVGIDIFTESDLVNFVNGRTSIGTLHRINVNEFVNDISFRHEYLKYADIEFI